MLKKRYNGRIVLIIAIAAFIIAMLILWYLENRFHFGARENTFYACSVAVLIAALAIRVTIFRRAEVIVQASDYPPADINPIRAGCIIDGCVDSRDVTSLFYYMANKGYIDINEYEFKRYEFTALKFPNAEKKCVQLLFKKIFDGTDVAGKTVKLVDAAPRLIEYVPTIEKHVYKRISNRRNKEIADMTGKVIGFKESMLKNKGEKLDALVAENSNYFFDILPYAYAFSITSKLSSNFEHIKLEPPKWYHPHGVEDNYEFDVIIYNSMLRNLNLELKSEVYDKTADTYPAVGSLGQ